MFQVRSERERKLSERFDKTGGVGRKYSKNEENAKMEDFFYALHKD
ncbi:MAG: hypothetical protein P0116_01835 [Candidatus Nitrosocosmicus sp.]|nr:hypothetical protein [Candidatus Nitrosocosmicus sp.]